MKKLCHVEVTIKKGESQEKLVKRFFKKVKKSGCIEDYLSKTSYFKTEKEKRKEKADKNKWLRQKNASENNKVHASNNFARK